MSDITITPLGAAIVEAMPDSRKMRAIQRAFKTNNVCPSSDIFTPAEVVAYYKERGQVVTSKDSGVKTP